MVDYEQERTKDSSNGKTTILMSYSSVVLTPRASRPQQQAARFGVQHKQQPVQQHQRGAVDRGQVGFSPGAALALGQCVGKISKHIGENRCLEVVAQRSPRPTSASGATPR